MTPCVTKIPKTNPIKIDLKGHLNMVPKDKI
jgi:hypothetical protein